jgi:drug/metabolite transporter (DMT)-like permease
VTLGVVFLDELADWRLLAGAALVVASLAVVNWKPRAAAVAAAAD